MKTNEEIAIAIIVIATAFIFLVRTWRLLIKLFMDALLGAAIVLIAYSVIIVASEYFPLLESILHNAHFIISKFY